MAEYQNLSLRCIKGQPINDVVCRNLVEMGFPVDAPKQSTQISAAFDSYFWKLSNSDYGVCGRVETEYITRLLENKNREKSFDTVLAMLSEYGITSSELAAGLMSGCVYSLSAEDAETMLDEFVFIIKVLLPRQLSDIYYSFDIEPNPAHSVFFDMAAKMLNLPRYTDRNKNNYGQFISHTANGVKDRILQGESFLSIYENTCATKEIIKTSYSEAMRSREYRPTRDVAYSKIEMALFGLSKRYKYVLSSSLPGTNCIFDFIILEDGVPIIAMDYWGENFIPHIGNPFTIYHSYDELIKKNAQKDKMCRANNVSTLQIDNRELYSGLYVGRLIRDVIKNPAVAKLHRMERDEYFKYGRAWDDAESNCDAVNSSKLCGCFECCKTIDPQQIVDWDFDDSAVCPYCGASAVIADSQGYEITEEYLHRLKAYTLENPRSEMEDDEDEI